MTRIRSNLDSSNVSGPARRIPLRENGPGHYGLRVGGLQSFLERVDEVGDRPVRSCPATARGSSRGGVMITGWSARSVTFNGVCGRAHLRVRFMLFLVRGSGVIRGPRVRHSDSRSSLRDRRAAGGARRGSEGEEEAQTRAERKIPCRAAPRTTVGSKCERSSSACRSEISEDPGPVASP